jgi:hypothetical protein
MSGPELSIFDLSPGEHHRVEIELSTKAQTTYPDARTIARKGYLVPKSDSE